MARRPASPEDQPVWRLALPEPDPGTDTRPDNEIRWAEGPEALEARGRCSPHPPRGSGSGPDAASRSVPEPKPELAPGTVPGRERRSLREVVGHHESVRPGRPGADPVTQAPPVLSLPERLIDARWQPRWTAVLAVLLLLLVAGATFGVRVALARGSDPASGSASTTRGAAGSGSVPSGGPSVDGASAAPSGPGAAGDVGAPSGGATATGVVVDVQGQVRRRGVARLGPGARVIDALTAAGGPLPAADLSTLNQARVLADGELVYVPRPGETVSPAAAGGTAVAGGAASPGAAGATPGGGGAAAGAVVDLNRATVEQLDALPGVGPAIAGRILEWRSQHGRFSTADELGEVQGIGPKLLERLRPLVRV